MKVIFDREYAQRRLEHEKTTCTYCRGIGHLATECPGFKKHNAFAKATGGEIWRDWYLLKQEKLAQMMKFKVKK